MTKVSRFQVMAMLQAARAHTLGLDIESSYSWGLNRATFIAAAKRGFKAGGGGTAGDSRGGAGRPKRTDVYYLGDDMAYKDTKSKTLRFVFGGKVQTVEEFDKRVKSRLGKAFPNAWKEALEYVGSFDKETLLSAEGFFGDVYRPRRDELAEKWTDASEDKGA